MKDILIILPTRQRAHKIDSTIAAWRHTTSGKSNLLLVIDNDDPDLEKYKEKYEPGLMLYFDEPIKMCPSVNRAFRRYPDYKYYAFIGDDHLFRTKGWEDIAIKEIGDKGIFYGNDLLQGKNLATHCVMSGNIPRALGYMAIPGLIHLFMDNFWMEIGNACGILKYRDDVIVEHMHPEAGKAVRDERYVAVNSSPVFHNDREVFLRWVSDQKASDVEKINGI